MELAATASATPIALWLNSFFAGYDFTILDFMNTLAVNAGKILTPLTKLITFLGEEGIIFFTLAVILMLFPKTRKTGVCLFGAVGCGALITSIILKDLIARVRPFMDEANIHYMDYKSFWNALGSPVEKGFSFPSGHVTSVTAAMFALLFTKGKKMILPTVLAVGLMMFSRNYLMAHYPSDVLAALVVGIISALIAWGISTLIFNYLEDNDDYVFCSWILTFRLPFAVPSVKSIKEKAADSFDGIKEKAADSFDGIKEKASSVSKAERSRKPAVKKQTAEIPEPEAARKKPAKKEDSDWNARWDEYRRAKHPEAFAAEQKGKQAADEDVKVFTGTKKEEQSISEAPARTGSAEKAHAAAPDFSFDGFQPPVSRTPAKSVIDDWDDLTALLNSDTDSYMEKRHVSDRSSRSQGGEYKGRHAM